MGCAFSRQHGRVPRIFKRKRVSKSRKYDTSTPPSVDDLKWPTKNINCLTPSKQPATPKHTLCKYTPCSPDVAPSTLLWMCGARDCMEDSIPELAVTNKHRDSNKQEGKNNEYELPELTACLDYRGYHEYGYHLFNLNSSVFNSTVQDLSLECIPEAVASVLGESYQPLVFVYKDNNNQTTYLPDPPAWGMEVLDKMCSRFGKKLLRIVMYNPSWYIQMILDEESANESLNFSTEVKRKLRVTSDFKELAKLTGKTTQLTSPSKLTLSSCELNTDYH